ncbi:MAG: hypothetical protein QOH14_3269, partial [Pseudonocardiales bacterium]|nr:hypothetical protein [Pseudonocardiales bacterium]
VASAVPVADEFASRIAAASSDGGGGEGREPGGGRAGHRLRQADRTRSGRTRGGRT